MASNRPKGRDVSLVVKSKTALYGTTVVASLLIFFTIYAPASLVFRFFQNDIARLPDTRIFQITGSIWNGSADIQFLRFPNSELSWAVVPHSLLKGYVEFALSASGISHELEGRFVKNGNQERFLGIRGVIDSKYINQVGQYHGILLSGTLDFQNINLSIDNRWFSSVSGNIDWTGGKASFQTGNGSQSVILPPLNGEFSVKDQKLTLYVYNEDKQVLSFHLQRDGWVSLHFMSRFLSLAGLPGGGNFDPDSVIFTIEEKIL